MGAIWLVVVTTLCVLAALLIGWHIGYNDYERFLISQLEKTELKDDETTKS